MKKTFSYLEDKGIHYTFIDYKKQSPDIEWLKKMVAQVGLENLINTKGTTYRQLSEEEKAFLSDEKKALALLQKKSSMIKRPILQAPSGAVVVGFDPEKINDLLS